MNDPLDVEARGGESVPAPFDLHRREIAGGHACTPLGRGKREVSVAGSDIEDGIACFHSGGVGKDDGSRLEHRRERRVLASLVELALELPHAVVVHGRPLSQ